MTTPPQSAQPAPPAATHQDSIDSLRGLASLYVLFHHIWQFAAITPAGESLPGWYGALGVLRPGSAAVAVFIVISGYCLMLPVARSPEGELRGGLRGFMRRRARRILPPYYAALLGSLLLIALTPALQARRGTQWDIALPALAGGPIVAHLALLHNLIEPWRWTINPPLWSVALELQIYVVFATALLPIWRRAGLLAAFCCATLLGIVPVWFGMDYADTYFVCFFALGMAAAVAGGAPWRLRRRWPLRAPWRALAALAWLGVLATLVIAALVPVHPTIVEELAGAATALWLVGRPGELRGASEAGPLGHPLLVGLGHFSYSLYLIHYPLLAALWALLLASGLSFLARLAATLLVGVPAILALAYGFSVVLERPFLSHPARPRDQPRPLAPPTAGER